jgi:hypothetical protein
MLIQSYYAIYFLFYIGKYTTVTCLDTFQVIWEHTNPLNKIEKKIRTYERISTLDTGPRQDSLFDLERHKRFLNADEMLPDHSFLCSSLR